MESDARNEILTSIRRNLAKSAPFDAAHHEHHAHKEKSIASAPLISSADLQNVSLTERFRENLISIGGICTIISDLNEAAKIIETIIEKSNTKRIAISDSDLVTEIGKLLDTNWEIVQNAPVSTLFETDLGITSAQFGIAETGTLVLESSREFHRLTSLVPSVHVCLLRAENIRQTLGETLEILEKDLSRTITFITGPSRTSDIELTLAIGVHGPAELHVIIIK